MTRRVEPSLFGPEPEAEVPEAPEAPAGTLYASVALNRPVRREFTYAVPPGLAGGVGLGSRVAVPFGRERLVGVVVGLAPRSGVDARRLKPVHEVLDPEPILDVSLLGLTRWMARRYGSSWGEALAAVLPAPLKRERRTRGVLVARVAPGVGRDELAELEERFPKQHRLLRTLLDWGGPAELRGLLRRRNLSESPARSLERRGWIHIERVDALPDTLSSGRSDRVRPERLSAPQELAVRAVGAALEEGRHATFLLQGVTGSGKTEVYLQAIERALAAGRGAIVLVPEIALTPQTVGWFRSRFGEVAVLHSGLTDVQRLAAWRRIRAGELRVVVGARSAVFAPLERLGVVVVDEEHEPSFKQGNVPRYHARDVAVERARRAGAVCLLGSATPSLESWQAAQAGGVRRLSLPERVGGGTMPNVHVVDMRLERHEGPGPPTSFSRTLGTFLRETVEAGEQAILFLNRRGFVPVLYCPGCERTVRCASCDVSLTYHRRIQRLVCHACCEELRLPQACPTCTRPGLRFLGAGSERVEVELARVLPGARVRRMDSDTMNRREDYEETLDAFGRGEVDVLVGTQMIAKGLDFPKVTLVGILSADLALHVPDFRASERTFQLIAQVAGRAGRAELPGRIVVQTLAPQHPAVALAAGAEFERFAREELERRREALYPPFVRVLRVVLEDPDERRVHEAADAALAALQRVVEPGPGQVLGHAACPVALLRGRHRRQVLVKGPPGDEAFEHAVDAAADLKSPSARGRVVVDVDPMSML